MPIDDTDKFESPGWWLENLAMQLHNRRVGRSPSGVPWSRGKLRASRARPPLLVLDDYRRGDPPLHEDIHRGWADPFRQYVRMGRLNVADLVTSAPANRMGVRDFRTAAADDELGDEKARDLMRLNQLKLVARDVHEDMLGLGDGYTLVTPPDRDEGGRGHSLITAESPLECITAHDPATGETKASLKLFRDEWSPFDWAYLFVGGRLHVARLEGPTSIRTRGPARKLAAGWTWVDEKSDDVPGGRNPITRFRNRRGMGEFESHLDTLDRINDKLFNEWWISKIQAFRQRALKLPDEDAEDLEDELGDASAPTSPDASDTYARDYRDLAGMFTSAPDALWQLPKDAEIWESSPVDINPLVNSISKDLEHLAAATSTPLHTITPDAANGSAQGASLMREEHVSKIEDRRDRADGGWARTMSMAFEFQGDIDRADVTKIEVLWGPLERYSLQEKADAASKLKGIVPVEAILTDILQYAPADVADRLRSLRSRELLFQPPAAPTSRT